MRREAVRLLKTLEHPCGYYEGRLAQNLVIDPLAHGLPQLYDLALERGFRRAGGHVYRPDCRRCRACVATRIPVEEFAPNRSQKRCARRNEDLEIALEPVTSEGEVYELYRRYLTARHPGGGMDGGDVEDFRHFVACHWSPTKMLTFRERGRLICVAVTDLNRTGASAVYTFYDPAQPQRALGTYAILSQIELAMRENIPWLYLGYWIDEHPKMAYKTRFRPIELMREGKWVRCE